MSWIFTEADFHGVAYSDYHRYDFFETRGVEFSGRMSAAKHQKVLVAGCGFGYLVEELMKNHGFGDVWGVDASAYAVGRAGQVLQSPYSSRIILGNVLTDGRAIRRAAGLRGNQSFSVCWTEDLLPCAESISEAQQMLTSLRAISGSLGHIITPMMEGGVKNADGSVSLPSGGEQMAGMLWMTKDEWIDVIGPGEEIIFTDEGRR